MRTGRGRGRGRIQRIESDSGVDSADYISRSNLTSDSARIPIGINPQPNSSIPQTRNNAERPAGVNRMEYEHKMPKCGDQVVYLYLITCVYRQISTDLSNFRTYRLDMIDSFRALNLMLNA